MSKKKKAPPTRIIKPVEIKPCPHKGCVYHTIGDNMMYGCDYAGMVGIPRTRGMTMEEALDVQHCPRYKPGRHCRNPHALPEKFGSATEPVNWARAREMHESGKPDKVIAAKLGCSVSAVKKWRYRNGLPANKVIHFENSEGGIRNSELPGAKN